MKIIATVTPRCIRSVMMLLLASAGVFISGHIRGQPSRVIDGLERSLGTSTKVEKAAALHALAGYYRRSDAGKFQEIRSQSRQLLADVDPAVRTYAEMIEGLFHETASRFDSAAYHLTRARESALAAHDDKIAAIVCYGMGRMLVASGKAGDAISNLTEGLRLCARDPDKEVAIRLRVSLVWAYLELKRYRDGITLGHEGLSQLDSTRAWMAFYFYNNMAVCYGALGLLDSARYFVEKGILGAAASHDYQSLANGHFILGTIYANAGRNDLAIEQYEKARPFREKVGNPLFIVSDLYTLASLYHKTKQYGRGVATGLEALSVAKEHHLLLKFENTYEVLAKNYEGLGDFRSASHYYQLWATAKDSVYQNANAQAIADMEAKYETEKKEQQIALQDATILTQQTMLQRNYILITALVIVVVLVTVIFLLIRSRLRRKQEVLRQEYELSVRETFISASIQSQENERKRFAQDLHDGMGQLISGLRFLMSKPANVVQLDEQKGKAEFILDDMHREIRSVAFNLMPQVLIRAGLVPALQEMASRINETGQLKLTVTSFDLTDRLSEVQEISLYRVAQEWLNNVLKYAHASMAHLQLVAHKTEITLTIEDDGAGFDKMVLQDAPGNGWKNIQSRLHLIKATADVDSLPGRKGTTLVVSMPWVRN